MVEQAFPNAFTPVNILSGFKKTGIYYPFNPNAVDDRQLAPLNAVSKKKTLSPQPVSEGDPVTSTEPPMLFSPEKEKLFAMRFEEDYDIQDPRYTARVKINHPECCLSTASNSSVSASSDMNHKSPTSKTDATTPPKSGAMVSGTEATTSSEPLKSTASESDMSDILALPKPKEMSGQKRKPVINQKTVCLTDDAAFDRFFSSRTLFLSRFSSSLSFFSCSSAREGEIKKGKRTTKKRNRKLKRRRQNNQLKI